jgi:uncharacterized integral membrane protein
VNGAARWVPIAVITLLAAAFASWNRGERVVVDVGFTTFYRAPFTMVIFLAFLAGMLSMLFLSLRHDLRVRRELQARGLLGVPAAPAAASAPMVPTPAAASADPAPPPPFDPFDGPVPEAESAALRVVPPPVAISDRHVREQEA